MIKIPRLFRLDENALNSVWAPILNEFIRDVLAGLTGLRERTRVYELLLLGGDVDRRLRIDAGVVEGVAVVGAFDLDSGAPVSSAVWACWRQDGREVVLRSVSGLTAGTRYALRLAVIGE